MKSAQITYLKICTMVLFVVIAHTAFSDANSQNTPNTLTKAELQEGWKFLFDGKTFTGWRGANMDSFPQQGWIIENGSLIVLKDGDGGDIVTEDKFSNFELTWEFKYEGNANSGLKYYVLEDVYEPDQALGLEYQLYYSGTLQPDDSNPQTMASLYDLIPAQNRELKPVGEWNNARIVSVGTKVEHWLNGKKVLEYKRGGKKFKDAVANSKFRDYNNFGEALEGHLLLQYHGDRMLFRNIKIRELEL